MNQRQLDLPGLLGMADDLDDGGAKAHVHDRGELHVHMNGAVPVSTIQEILADEATSFPAGFDLERDMTRLAPCKSLAEYLTPWQVLRLFPKKRANLVDPTPRDISTGCALTLIRGVVAAAAVLAPSLWAGKVDELFPAPAVRFSAIQLLLAHC